MSVALVTGAGRRIGKALALALAADGYDVGLHYLSSEAETQALAREITALGRRALLLRADLADPEQATGLVAACRDLGAVACLVNNAALYVRDGVDDLTADSLDAHHAVNLRAPILLARAVAAQLPEGENGLIVNMLDFHVAALTPRFFSYGVSKAALAAATEMLAIELAPRIRVCAIAPGLVLPSPYEDGERFARLRGETLLRRGVVLDDIVAALRYLLTASTVTGQTLYVDSGQRLISKRNPS